MQPIPPELAQSINALSPLQLAWLSGYCWARADGTPAAIPASAPHTGAATTSTATAATATPEATPLSVTVLSASQTGNARKVAENLLGRLQQQGLQAQLVAAADYKPKAITDEQLLLLVTSTQGEGEPPEEAVSLHKFLFGKKAPQLVGLQFAVLGLGDTSYPRFCGAARDFDDRLAELGGTRLLERQDCDLDFEAAANAWLDRIVPIVAQHATPATPATSTTATSSPAALAAADSAASAYSKENPFPATLSVRQKITGRHSEKDVRHIEIDLSGSGLRYQPGDALGVWFSNDAALVDEILAATSLAGHETITIQGQSKTIREALVHDLEITQNTPQFVKGYAELAGSDALRTAVAANALAFAEQNPIVSIVRRYPAALAAEQLAALLRPITPRLYSIASAQDEVGDEVHLTVGVLRYEHDGCTRTGGASGYLAERVEEDGEVRVFVEHNPNFRLPANPETPVIMIGSGTGIAPFRAFMQQRAAAEAPGKNWLIFGNQRFSEDFLYQTEWQGFAKNGYLHQYHFAWSRDQAEKIYVQDKIRENAAALWQWLQNGAHIYVCGSASHMAKDVEQALLDVIAAQGACSAEDAEEYLDELRQNKRYQRDVY